MCCLQLMLSVCFSKRVYVPSSSMFSTFVIIHVSAPEHRRVECFQQSLMQAYLYPKIQYIMKSSTKNRCCQHVHRINNISKWLKSLSDGRIEYSAIYGDQVSRPTSMWPSQITFPNRFFCLLSVASACVYVRAEAILMPCNLQFIIVIHPNKYETFMSSSKRSNKAENPLLICYVQQHVLSQSRLCIKSLPIKQPKSSQHSDNYS